MRLFTLYNITIPTEIEINKIVQPDGNKIVIRKRTEKGWTLDFIFNRENLPWSDGKVFYYWGIKDETNPFYYLDNNLSFSFTSIGAIIWKSYKYTGFCDPVSGYTGEYQYTSGTTPPLCDNGTSNDFNISITFERNMDYYDCEIENEGGWNDLITGWTVTNPLNVISGATEEYVLVETLNQKWLKEKNKRLGTLKVYLNGHCIYKLENWEEIIPSLRKSTNGIYQIWGGGTTGCVGIHEGNTLFNLKRIKYYEEPLNYLALKERYININKVTYNITECQDVCVDNLN